MHLVTFLQLVNAAVFIVAAGISWALTKACVQVSYRFDLLDYPTGRKKHLKPMPFLGGTAIFLAFWTVVFVGWSATHLCGSLGDKVDVLLASVRSVMPKLVGIFLGGLVILFVGLYDDKFRWTPGRKLLGQCAAAAILMGLGFQINLVSGLGPVGYVITFIWILMIINAFNFIDSLDGHCTGIALISTLIFFIITQILNQPMIGLLLMTFAGALFGFFPHNFNPAKIFLGDNGSLFIGYMLAAFTLLCKYQIPEATYATLFIPVLVFGVPIYDMLSVITVRLARGVAPWKGDRNHFAHRLVKIGMSDQVAVTFSYFIAVTIGLVAVLTTQVDFFGAVLIMLIFISIIGVIAFLEYYAAESARVASRLLERKKRHTHRKGE
jgi:UDP-GlcNAc:undecaprenyl-phosphate GlcNAc-1-phosphate transferase